MTNKNPRAELRDRALGAIVRDAFFTWPSAVLISFFAGLAVLGVNLPVIPGWQAWMWLPIGALAEAAYLYATATDPEAGAKAVSRMLTDRYDPRTIRNNNAREQLIRALEYKSQIDKFVGTQTGVMKLSMADTASDINDWIGRIYNLAKHIDMFETNVIINRDRQNVPTEIANLKRRLSAEPDESVKGEIQEALRIRQNLLKQLDGVGNTAKRAELQMENTIAQLGTVYAQMQLIDARDLDSGQAKRIQENIREEIAQLSDTLAVMDDLYTPAGTISARSAVNNLAEPESAELSAGSTNTSSSAARRSGSSRQ